MRSKKKNVATTDEELAGLFDRICELTEHLIPDGHDHFTCVSCTKDPRYAGSSGAPCYMVWVEYMSPYPNVKYTILKHSAFPYEGETLLGTLNGVIDRFEEEREMEMLAAADNQVEFDHQAVGFGQ
jgi:hypothetical protein